MYKSITVIKEKSNQNKEMKIADSVLLSLFTRDMKEMQHLSRPIAPA